MEEANIQRLIGEGKLEAALAKISHHYKDEPHFFDLAIQIKSRYYRLKKIKSLGLISQDSCIEEENKISYVIQAFTRGASAKEIEALVIDLDAGVNLTGLLKHFYLLRLPKWAYLLFFVGLFVMVLLLVGIGGYFVKNNYDSIQTASTERMVAIKGGRTTIGQSGKGVIDNPSHEVLLDAYWIDQFEVTVKQYVAFCKTQNYKLPKDPKFQTMPNYFTDSRWENYPAVNVTWYDAQKYCDCLHKRLPTEAEWENAARNTTIKNVKQFQTSMENYPDRSLLAYSPNYGIIEGKADAYPFTAEVGSFSKNSYHLFDMGGNVSEWCLDSYSKDFYLIGQIDNPVNQEESDYAVVRGPSWLEWKGGNVAKRDRKKKSMGYRNVGFRCVTTNQSN